MGWNISLQQLVFLQQVIDWSKIFTIIFRGKKGFNLRNNNMHQISTHPRTEANLSVWICSSPQRARSQSPWCRYWSSAVCWLLWVSGFSQQIYWRGTATVHPERWGVPEKTEQSHFISHLQYCIYANALTHDFWNATRSQFSFQHNPYLEAQLNGFRKIIYPN